MIAESAAAKAIGGLCGALLALVFIPPRSKSGLLRRGIAAVIFGPISAPFIAPLITTVVQVQSEWDLYLGASGLGAFCSWWLLGAGKKIAERFGSKEET